MQIARMTARIGAEITAIDVRHPHQPLLFAAIRQAVLDHQVVVLRRQRLTPRDFVEFASQFGSIEPYDSTVKEYLMPAQPEIIVLSNVEEDGQRRGVKGAGQYWHTDRSYVPQPAWLSMLHAIEVPRDATGAPLGDTLFASMTAAAAALSEAERRKLVRLSAWHQYVYRFTTADQPLPGVAHPILLRHPLTAAECLYVNSGFTHRILGVAKARGAVLLNQLYAHARRDEFVYRHRWEVGDIVIWDNYSTQHCAVADYGPAQRRHMWRTTIQGFPLDDAASESEMMADSEAS